MNRPRAQHISSALQTLPHERAVVIELRAEQAEGHLQQKRLGTQSVNEAQKGGYVVAFTLAMGCLRTGVEKVELQRFVVPDGEVLRYVALDDPAVGEFRARVSAAYLLPSTSSRLRNPA
ncbi:hypothetical protein [Streptomyces sp. NPDC096311]|uniref:hypothetical protein n=1 Tax=Streptomyces sp. NPDC096311 TaxID=3366083 RepID=UPI0037F7E97C